MRLRILPVSLLIACLPAATPQSEEFRLVRSISGPSGTLEGSRFVIPDVRNRFVYPQDKSFVVYFEWDSPPGQHILTATWKQPDGRIGSISPDVKIESTTRDLKCYWIYTLASDVMDGVWTIEVRIDGRPAGAHPFEIVVADGARPKPAREPVKAPTLDQIFRAASPSIVWVHKLDAGGRRADTSSGFIFGKNRVVTAFQAVDSGTKLQIEFAGGRTVETDEVLAYSRTGDWAVLKADTADSASLETGDPARVAVGERLIVFNVEGGARVIGGVDISGRRDVPGFGPRIQLSPAVAVEAAGGPLLELSGRVVGILGGSTAPGTRFDRRSMTINAGLWSGFANPTAAVPISAVPGHLPENGTTLHQLAADGKLTAPLSPMPEFMYGGTAMALTKNANETLPPSLSEFSRRDPQFWVYSLWQRRARLSKGLLSAKMYDSENRLRGDVAQQKVSLSSVPLRWACSFKPAPLTPGVYRIDVLWDGQPVWRTFIRVSE